MDAYKAHRQEIFTEEGFRALLGIKKNVIDCIAYSGAVTAENAWNGVSGDSFLLLNCLDYLVEIGEIKMLSGPETAGQRRVYISGK